jgi:predicted nucleic acid-binding protein
MMVDTDVLIWYLKGNELARLVLEQLPRFFISSVTYIELLQGMRNKQELLFLRRALKTWHVKTLHISEEISIKAAFYVEQYCLSHSMQFADALIAATAEIHGLEVLTGNIKHYRVLENVCQKEFRPVID